MRIPPLTQRFLYILRPFRLLTRLLFIESIFFIVYLPKCPYRTCWCVFLFVYLILNLIRWHIKFAESVANQKEHIRATHQCSFVFNKIKLSSDYT